MSTANVRPGLVHGLEFRGFTADEHNVAHEFGRIFRVNFARVQEFKNRTYAFILARPTNDYLQRYILEDRELLVLFNRDSSFDGRLFDFVDYLNETYRNRLDKLCMVLVGREDDLAERVDDYVRRQAEARLVIPIRFSEAGSDLEAILQRRLSQFFFGRDLFAFSSPLKSDAYFYGRTGILQFIYEKYRNGENAGLFGLRKVGKTSVLNAVQRWLGARDEPSVLIDCQNADIQLRSWNELLFRIVERLIDAQRLGFLRPKLKESRYEPKLAANSFEQDLSAISDYLEGKRILILFDEIESITFDLSARPQWREGTDFLLFWQTLRAVYQSRSELLSFVITGVNPKAIETHRVNGVDNPIFRIVSPNYLEFFPHEEVERMVTETGRYMGLTFDPEVISGLTVDFGGHPFLVRQACSSLHKRITARPATVDRFFYEDVRADIERELFDYVEQIVSVLRDHYGTEYELLEGLALGDRSTFDDWAEAEPSIIDHLIGYGLVRRSFDRYHLSIRCVGEYLRRNSRKKALLSSKEERQREVSETRNRLEGLLRRTIRLVMLTAVGAEQAKRELLSVMFKNSQKQKMEHLSFNEMLQSQDRELYLSDLGRLILKNWERFFAVFGSNKVKFENFIEIVNRSRIDAHDKDLTDDELANFRHASKWLIDNCAQYLGDE